MNIKDTILLLLFLLTITDDLHGQMKNKKKIESSLNEIVGTWKLVEFSNLDSTTNKWIHPYGKNPNGYISYSRSGVVNINLSSEIPIQIPKDSIDHFRINLEHFWQNYALGYYGTYTVNNEKHIVIHHVIGGTIPEYINTDQIRPFVIKNDTLTIGDGKVWRRVLVRVD